MTRVSHTRVPALFTKIDLNAEEDSGSDSERSFKVRDPRPSVLADVFNISMRMDFLD